jgi:hypothetical protein
LQLQKDLAEFVSSISDGFKPDKVEELEDPKTSSFTCTCTHRSHKVVVYDPMS